MADKNEKQKKGTEGGIEEDSGTAFTTGYDEKVVSAEGEGDAGMPPENHESDASPSGVPEGEETGAVLKQMCAMPLRL